MIGFTARPINSFATEGNATARVTVGARRTGAGVAAGAAAGTAVAVAVAVAGGGFGASSSSSSSSFSGPPNKGFATLTSRLGASATRLPGAANPVAPVALENIPARACKPS